MGKNKGKKKEKTEYQKFKSMMAKMEYQKMKEEKALKKAMSD